MTKLGQLTVSLILVVAAISAGCQLMAGRSTPIGLYETFGTITSYDARFDALVGRSQLEKLAAGFEWTEGPVWMKERGYLLFSDIPRNSIFKWKEDEGLSLYLKPAGYFGEGPWGSEPGTNGLLLDPAGRLVMCEHGNRRISRLEREQDAVKTTLVSHYMGRQLNSPNDAVYMSNGDLYFTDPPYGLPNRWNDSHRELEFCGVYRLAKDGNLTLLTKEMTRPNGIGLSPDEKTLYVAQSDPQSAIWMAFDVQEDGTITHGRVFYDGNEWVKQKRPGLPDGLKVDQAGNVFATGPGGVHVFAPDGTYLGNIDTGQRTANCGWGDDGSTLYICADMYLARIKLNTKGLGF